MSPTLEKHEVDPIRAVLDREYESEPFGVVRLYKLVEKVFQFSDIYGAIFLLKKKSGSDPMLFGIVSVLPPYKTLFLHYIYEKMEMRIVKGCFYYFNSDSDGYGLLFANKEEGEEFSKRFPSPKFNPKSYYNKLCVQKETSKKKRLEISGPRDTKQVIGFSGQNKSLHGDINPQLLGVLDQVHITMDDLMNNQVVLKHLVDLSSIYPDGVQPPESVVQDLADLLLKMKRDKKGTSKPVPQSAPPAPPRGSAASIPAAPPLPANVPKAPPLPTVTQGPNVMQQQDPSAQDSPGVTSSLPHQDKQPNDFLSGVQNFNTSSLRKVQVNERAQPTASTNPLANSLLKVLQERRKAIDPGDDSESDTDTDF